MSTPPDQKLPITAVILLLIHITLNFMLSSDFFFWAFYGTLHKAHLLPTSPSKFDSSKQLTEADFRFFPGIPSLSFAGARVFTLWKGGQIPPPCILHSNLCLTTAILHAFSLTSPISTAKHLTWLKPPHQACRFLLIAYFSETQMSIILWVKLHQTCFFVMTTYILSLATIL